MANIINIVLIGLSFVSTGFKSFGHLIDANTSEFADEASSSDTLNHSEKAAIDLDCLMAAVWIDSGGSSHSSNDKIPG